MAELFTGIPVLFRWNGNESASAENMEYIAKALGAEMENVPGVWQHPYEEGRALFTSSFANGIIKRQTDIAERLFNRHEDEAHPDDERLWEFLQLYDHATQDMSPSTAIREAHPVFSRVIKESGEVLHGVYGFADHPGHGKLFEVWKNNKSKLVKVFLIFRILVFNCCFI